MIKLGSYAPDLGETEFVLYYMNYRIRRPLISGTTANVTAAAIGRDLAQLGMIGATGGTVDRETLLGLETFSKAQIVYPEDIQLYGFSFNTLVGDTSVAGEIAHRQDEPLQIDDVELLFAAMPQQLANAGLRPDLDGISQVQNYGPGEYAEGFIRLDTTQAQVTFTHLFGPTLGMSNLTMLAEVGGVWIHESAGAQRRYGTPFAPVLSRWFPRWLTGHLSLRESGGGREQPLLDRSLVRKGA